MTIRQIIGLVMLVAALMFGAVEFWYAVSPAYGAPNITMASLWVMVSARSMNIVQSLITRDLWSPIWDIGIWPILGAPAWSFFGVLSIVFLIFGRPKTSDR